jgi:F1F0 ATPase subunit 2
MTSLIALWLVLLTGLMLGGFFFGGLWWTVQKGLASNHPAFWFFGSTLLRTAIALFGFYLVARDDWRKLLVCLLGFVLGRALVTHFTRSKPEEIHAPQQ